MCYCCCLMFYIKPVTDLKSVSLSLYHYLCQHIVGTKNHVKNIRMTNAVRDNVSSENGSICITSGSFGEGLEMRGSDIDIMFVDKYIEVLEKTSTVLSPSKTYLVMVTEDTKPCFTMLRLIQCNHPLFLKFCEKIKTEQYLSNALFKQYLTTMYSPVIHGPSVSDKDGFFDLVYCLHSKSWITPASQWIQRSNKSWPDEETKQLIINHGVLFVPIGFKGSSKEEMEWRMSFSIAEKLLIYTFSHTQLLCYALMKIFLKDVITIDERCQDLLCSYYLITIIFWISEEVHPSVWTPENLIPCFMGCFCRLHYCVKYFVCPHYFIPENNMFENKIEKSAGQLLVNTLSVFLSYGWRCILFSKQLSRVQLLNSIPSDPNILYYEDINKFLGSQLFQIHCLIRANHNNYIRGVQRIVTCRSNKLKYIYMYYISLMCNQICQSINCISTNSNKNQYKNYKTCLTYLLMNIHHDAVSGWLMLASLFYKTKQYEKALQAISYSLSKKTDATFFRKTRLSTMQQYVLNLKFFKKKEIVRILQFLLFDCVKFTIHSRIVPVEVPCYIRSCPIPPVYYAHILKDLCYEKPSMLKNPLIDLQMMTAERRPLISTL